MINNSLKSSSQGETDRAQDFIPQKFQSDRVKILFKHLS